MGMDIHVETFKLDKETNRYSKLTLYHKRDLSGYTNLGPENIRLNEKEYLSPVSIYDGRDYEMFNGLKDGDEDDGYGIFPWHSIYLNSFDDDAKKEISETMNTEGFFDFHEIALSEMALYCNEHPMVVDYDANWDLYNEGKAEKPMKKNPICDLYNDIYNYIKFADPDSWIANRSDYKVIFYFDW